MKQNVTYVSLHPRAKMHAAFALATILSCGFAGIPWIIWAIATRNKVY